MDDFQKYNQLIHSLRQDVAERINFIQSQITTLQSELKMLALMSSKLESLSSEYGLTASDVEIHDSDTVVIADGKPLSANRIPYLLPKRFDVILDLVLQSMWARVDPDAKSMLVKCNIAGWRIRKLRLLAYMLEHPTIPVGLHNIHTIYRDGKEVERNTFAQTIRSLRMALHQTSPQGPYIINTTVWDRAATIEEFIGNGYVMNDRYHYLVILHDFENHRSFIANLIKKS